MAQKQAFSTTLTNLLTRVRTVLTETTFYVRTTAYPNWAEYIAEEGVTFAVSSPEPDSTSGAGRWGLKVKRRVVVLVATQCTLDEASRDELALTQHLDLEESVVDAILDGHPTIDSREGITVNWVGGGQEITRQLPTDTSRIVSALVFEVTYAAAVTSGPYAP